jgi:hypothetical protein
MFVNPDTELRDRIFALAKAGDVEAGYVLCHGFDSSWFAAQALAYVGRFAEDADRSRELIIESVNTAERCADAFERAAVSSWPLRAAVERSHHDLAATILANAVGEADNIENLGSRSEALFHLYQASFPLGKSATLLVLERIISVAKLSPSWRSGRAAVDALVIHAGEDKFTSLTLAEELPEGKYKRQATSRLHSGGASAPRTFFH